MVVCELVRRVSQPLRTVQDLERYPEHTCLSDTYVISYIESVNFVSTFYEKMNTHPSDDECQVLGSVEIPNGRIFCHARQ